MTRVLTPPDETEMRVIAVGDDDQNIFEFRDASSEYMVNCCRNSKGQAVLKFSKQLIKLIEERNDDTCV